VPRIPFFKLGSSEPVQPPRLTSYFSSLSLDGLQLGIDNLRHDVWLSPAFCKAAGESIGNLIAKYGNVESVMAATTTPAGINRSGLTKLLSGLSKKSAEIKPLLRDLHKVLLLRAKAGEDLRIDLLGRAAILKFLRAELNNQFAGVLERCRATLRGYEGVRQQKALEYRETVASF